MVYCMCVSVWVCLYINTITQKLSNVLIWKFAGLTDIAKSLYSKSSLSKSGGSIWASLKCQCCFWLILAGVLVSYLITMWLLTLQLFKNSTDTQEKPRLNLHSLSVLLEYRRKWFNFLVKSERQSLAKKLAITWHYYLFIFKNVTDKALLSKR
jgi:hypothetical protein